MDTAAGLQQGKREIFIGIGIAGDGSYTEKGFGIIGQDSDAGNAFFDAAGVNDDFFPTDGETHAGRYPVEKPLVDGFLKEGQRFFECSRITALTATE